MAVTATLNFTFKILLFIHILAGTTGLVTGILNIVRKKGDKPHKKIGRLFLYGMIINGIAGLFMSIIHFNLFLFIIGIFSIYLASTGQRYLSLKNISTNQKPKNIDWVLSFTMLFFAIAFIIYGVLLLLSNKNFGIVLLVFGFISSSMAIQDFRNYKAKNTVKNFWLLVHIQRMIGSFIAAFTAFLVVNNTILPGVIAWLLPTVVFVPLIFFWVRKYKVTS